MQSSNFRLTAACAITLAAVTATLPLNAQTIRPGGSARGTNTRGGNTTTRSSTSVSSGVGGARQYRSNTQLGDAVVQIDPETRSLVIVTDEETHAEMLKVIRDLDRPKPQVLIKVVFLEVTYDKGYDIGVEGSYTFNLQNPVKAVTGTQTENSVTTGTSGNGTITKTITSNITRDIGSAANAAQTAGIQSLFGLATATDGSFVRVATDDWSATLRALATHGKVEVLSRPSIMARNNQEAVIVVGQEVPFITNSRTDALGQVTNTIQYDNVGIILRVTPFITANNSVEMIVAPEISNLTSQTVPISNNASAPVIAKRSAETVVVTPNGSTAVIGGLMETQRIESTRKIPILGDIPILGFPFRRKIKDDVKRELMIFLTPTIVSTPEGVEEITEHETENAELVKRSFTEKDFEHFFDTLPTRANVKEEVTITDKEVVVPEVRQAIPFKTEKVKTEVVSETQTTAVIEQPAEKPIVIKPATVSAPLKVRRNTEKAARPATSQ